jgi:hypothetical protein
MKTTINLFVLLFLLIFSSCHKNKNNEEVYVDPNAPIVVVANPLGFNVLNKIKGIWNGPVTSTTPLGGYPEWIVDFRPISENQVSAKNELDTLNDIFMSFFIVKHNGENKVAFRNGGSFVGMKRVSYFLADSVSETSTTNYYRFSEIIKGKNRAFTEVIFRADSVYIKSYTNKYNTLTTSTPHMTWSAKLQDETACLQSTTLFSYPKNTIAKDFNTVFVGQSEAIYYATSGIPAGDPYPENNQPYLGKTTATYDFAPSYTASPTKKVFLVITTHPLFSGLSFISTNLKYRSRYVILLASSSSFVFNYMHPGTYFYYAYYDNDGNNFINSGDWLSTANTIFTLNAIGTTTINTQINFTIP